MDTPENQPTSPRRAVRKVASVNPGPLPVGQLPYADQADHPAKMAAATAEPLPYDTNSTDLSPLVGHSNSNIEATGEHVATGEPTYTPSQVDDQAAPDTPVGKFAATTETYDPPQVEHRIGDMTTSDEDDTNIPTSPLDSIADLDDYEPEDDNPHGTASQRTTHSGARNTRDDDANIRTKRDTDPRRNLVTFTDTEDGKRLTSSTKKKRNRLNKGGMFFNARDREIVLLVAAHGWLDITQICDLLGTGVKPNALRHSLKRLVDHGLLDAKYTGFQAQLLYTSTAFGLRLVGAEGFNTTNAPRLQTIEHTDAITAVHIYFVQNARENVIFMTERELYAAVASGQISPRLTNAAPWTSGYTDFATWVPQTTTDKGKPITKRPDGYLLQMQDGKLVPPMPVEVERSIKTRTDYYEQALLMFANTAKSGHILDTVVYFAPSSTGVMKDLEDALNAVYDTTKGARWPEFLPKVNFAVYDLDPLYTPYSAERGWIPGKTHTE